MMQFNRFAIYFTPRPGPFATKGASWLGWDIASGTQMVAAGGELVSRPHKYGFHATIKPPCRLAGTHTLTDVAERLNLFCAQMAPVQADALTVNRLGSFLALTPVGDTDSIGQLAANVVREMDLFRAEPTETEQQKRKRSGMSQQMLRHIEDWGYPHVMDLFRFHMTVTGPVPKADQPGVQDRVWEHFGRSLPEPFVIDSLTLCGEAQDDRFHEISRHDLRG